MLYVFTLNYCSRYQTLVLLQKSTAVLTDRESQLEVFRDVIDLPLRNLKGYHGYQHIAGCEIIMHFSDIWLCIFF